MAVPFELLDKYQITFIDFWRLRPRGFLIRVRAEPTKYLSAAQFMGVSSTLMLALIVIAMSVNQQNIEKITGSKMASPEALAGRYLVMILVVLLGNTLLYRIISPRWPVRGKVNFVSLFEFQCYMVAILIPFLVIDVVLDPIGISLVASKVAPSWVLFIPAVIGGVAGFVCYFLYQNPGIAALNGVSSLRMFLGTAFWVMVFQITVGVVVAIVVGIVLVTR